MHNSAQRRITQRAVASTPSKRRTSRAQNYSFHINCRSSIKDFIDGECPAPGWDRVYREQPQNATVEAELLEFNNVWSPGCILNGALSTESFSNATGDSGNIIITPAADRGKTSSKGSNAALCQIVAAQNVGASVRIRLLVQQRVLLQAVASSATLQRAQAAVLDDRWVYYTRAGALEEAASTSPSAAASPIRPEVLTALGDCLEAAEEVLTLMRHMSELAQKLAGGPEADGPQAELVADAAQEWDRLLSWVENVDLYAPPSYPPPSSTPSTPSIPASSPTPSPPFSRTSGSSADGTVPSPSSLADSAGAGGSAGESVGGAVAGSQLRKLKVAGRVSYAPFAAAATPALLGCTAEEVEAGRVQAMRVTDTGNRLEEAAEYLQTLKSRLSARLMLQQL